MFGSGHPGWLPLHASGFYRAMLCIDGTSHGPVSVCLSVTSRSSTTTAKRRITQTTPHDSPGTLVFLSQRCPRNLTRVTGWQVRLRDVIWHVSSRSGEAGLLTAILFSSTSTYHSTDLLTARGVAHLVVHGTSGSTSYETIPPVRLESYGDVLSTVDMVVQRRDGPRRLREHMMILRLPSHNNTN